jgi:hypothetical protein
LGTSGANWSSTISVPSSPWLTPMLPPCPNRTETPGRISCAVTWTASQSGSFCCAIAAPASESAIAPAKRYGATKQSRTVGRDALDCFATLAMTKIQVKAITC